MAFLQSSMMIFSHSITGVMWKAPHALLALRYSNADSTPSTGFTTTTTTTNSEEQLKQLLKQLKEQRKMPPPAKAKRPYRKKSAYWEQRAKGSSSNKLAELRDITSKEIN